MAISAASPSSITAQLVGMFFEAVQAVNAIVMRPLSPAAPKPIVDFLFVHFVMVDTFFFHSQVSLLSFIVESDHTFLDYIKGGYVDIITVC